MVIIDKAKCIGCGLCVADCFPGNLVLENGKAATVNESCIQCGHCVAICPENALQIDDYDMADVAELTADTSIITADGLLGLIKGRRSIRCFKDMPVEPEKITKMIEAGRYTPTGGNRQEIAYVVVEEKMPEFRALAIENLAKISEVFLAAEDTQPQLRSYAERWKNIYIRYLEEPQEKDTLFFSAPVLILITGDSLLDVGLAASNMELMASVLGLGLLYSGFIARACQHNKKIKELLGIKENHEVLACLIIGYPDVRYVRTAPRKAADIHWN